MNGPYLALRACERFGMAPFAGKASFDELDAGEQALLLDFERLRLAEEQGQL